MAKLDKELNLQNGSIFLSQYWGISGDKRFQNLITLALLLLQSTLVFSDEIGAIVFSNQITSSSIFGYNSEFVKMMGTFDISKLLRNKDVYSLHLLILTLIAGLVFSLILVHHRNLIFETNGNIKFNSFDKLAWIGIALSDILLFVSTNIFFGTIMCKEVLIKEVQEGSTGSLIDIIAYDLLIKSDNSIQDSDLIISKRLYVTNNVSCYSPAHISLALLSSMCVFLSTIALYRKHKISRFIPSVNHQGCKEGGVSLLFESVIVIMVALKIACVCYAQGNTRSGKVLLGIYCGLLFCCLLINSQAHPFYFEEVHLQRAFQILFLLIIAFIELSYSFVADIIMSSELTLVIALLLFLPIIVKFNLTINTVDISKIINSARSPKLMSEHELLHFYFRTVMYHFLVLKGDEEEGHNEIGLLINHIYSHHRDHCIRSTCSCKDKLDLRLSKKLLTSNSKLMLKLILVTFEEVLRSKTRRSETINDTYLYFLSMYLGRLNLASFLLEDRLVKLKKKNPIEKSALAAMIHKVSSFNRKYGFHSLTEHPSLLRSEINEGNEISVESKLNFIKMLELAKYSFRSCIITRINFMKAVYQHGRVKDIYYYALSFEDSKHKLVKIFELLSSSIKTSFAPLLLLESAYLIILQQDRKQGIRLLNEYKIKQNRRNINALFSTDEICSDHELNVITSKRSPKGMYIISYCPPTLKKWLGYSATELEGSPVSRIIASPILQIHDGFMNNPSGKLLSSRHYRSVYCRNKKGFLVDVKLGVRYLFDVQDGLGYYGILQFKGDRKTKKTMLVDSLGKIAGISENMDDDFIVGNSVFNSNIVLEKVLGAFRSVISQKLKSESIKNLKLSPVSKNTSKFKLWTLYNNWRAGKRINMLNIDKQVVLYTLSIKEEIISDNSYYYIFDMTQLVHRDFNPSIIFEAQKNDDDDSCIVLDEDHEEAEAGATRLFLANPNQTRRGDKSISTLQNWQGVFNRPSMMRDDALFIKRKHCSKNKRAESLEHFQAPSYKEMRCDKFIVKKEDKIEEVEKTLHNLMNPSSISKIVLVAGFCMVVIFFVQMESIYLKQDHFKYIVKDIREQIPVPDLFTWEIWAQLGFSLYLDICRYVREGWLPDDYGKDWGKPSLNELCMRLMLWTGAVQLKCDTLIDAKVRNITRTDLFDVNGWRQTKVPMKTYFLDNRINKLYWESYNHSRMTSIKVLQGLALDVRKRNYTITESIQSISLSSNPDIQIYNRELDPDEEMVRKNLNGLLNREYADRSYDYYEYFKRLVRSTDSINLWTFIISSTSCIIAFLLISIMLFKNLISMRNAYYTFLKVKTEDFLRVLSSTEAEKRLFDTISKEEKWTQINHRKKRDYDEFDSIVLTTGGSTSLNKQYVKLDLGGAYFGLTTPFCILVLLVSILCAFQGLYFYMVYKTNRPVVMIGDTYIMYSEAWSGFFTLHATFFNVMFWNNSSPFWEMEALKAYEKQKDHVLNNIIQNISETMTYDLGNYTEKYRYALSKGNSCETLFIQANRCFENYDGLMNTNVINSLKGIITVLDSILLRWSIKRSNWADLRKMMMGRTMITVLVNFEDFVDPFIYFGIRQLSKSLDRQLNISSSSMQSYYAFYFWFTSISTILGTAVLIYSIQGKITAFNRSFCVIPFELVQFKRSLWQMLIHKKKL